MDVFFKNVDFHLFFLFVFDFVSGLASKREERDKMADGEGESLHLDEVDETYEDNREDYTEEGNGENDCVETRKRFQEEEESNPDSR